MTALAVASSSLKNFQLSASVIAGGGASVLTIAVGAILVALGVTVPFIGIPLTMTMVTSAAVPIGHIVTALVPDTYNQQINALASKVQTDVETLKMIVPQVECTYPADKETGIVTGNMQ